MTKKQIDALVKKVAKAEGKKVSVSAGNIREILAIVADLCWKEVGWAFGLIEWGQKRQNKK